MKRPEFFVNPPGGRYFCCVSPRMNTTGREIPVIGIVGGIGAGKSTVARELAALGCSLINADVIGYDVLNEPDVRQLARRRWGQRVFDAGGKVDRKALGEIVFDDPVELEALNGIMWPRIRRRIEERIEQVRRDVSIPAVVLDAAVLFEAGWDDLCSHVLFVAAPDEVRARRALERGWDQQAWRKREKLQFSLDSKAARCYGTVDSSSSVSHLRQKVQKVFRQIIHDAERS